MRIREHPVVTRIRPQLEQTLADYGYELVVARLGGRPGRQTLALYIDKPGGVTSADCQYVATRVSLLLDILDPIVSSYKLIVSSPGLDRPLASDADFERFSGRPAKVRVRDAAGRRTELSGTLGGLRESNALLDTPAGRIEVPLADIESAKLVHQWEGEAPQAMGTQERIG